MFKKKFQVRVRRYYNNDYCVEYSFSRFENWKKIKRWLGFPSCTEIPILLSWADAEKFAQEFKSIEDINMWENEQERLCKKELIAIEESEAVNRPYEFKQIL